MQHRLLQFALLAGVVLVAAGFRLTGLLWDDLQHHHPDERYISWVATTIEWPAAGLFWRTVLEPQSSPLNPFHWPAEASSEGIVVLQDQPRDFAYGHVPLYLGVVATKIAEKTGDLLRPFLPAEWAFVQDLLNGSGRIEFHFLTLIGRATTALVSIGTVILIFLLGRWVYDWRVGLLAASFLAVAVMPVQQAHFFISDPFMTFFVTAALLFMVLANQAAPTSRGGSRENASRWSIVYLMLAGIAAGLAIGSKFSAVLLIIPLAYTAVIMRENLRQRLALVAVGLLATAVMFLLTNPFAVLDWTCHISLGSLEVGSCYLDNILKQSAMARGGIDLGFTRQYQGTLPYLYFIEMQLRWGLGPAMGIAALGGFIWAVWQLFIDRGWMQSDANNSSTSLGRTQDSPEVAQSLAILLLWVGPYFLITGMFYVKFMRYMLPIIPVLLLFAAAMIVHIPSRQWRWATALVVLLPSLLYGASFLNIYRVQHPWNAASEWVHRNVEPGALILSEQWDDYLPVTMTVDGYEVRRDAYKNQELTWLSLPDERDNSEKLAQNLEMLAQADYLTVMSQRVYGVVPRLTSRFPISGQYHQLLFDGDLGYEAVWVGGRYPQLLGRRLGPDLFSGTDLEPPDVVVDYEAQQRVLHPGRADESFTVYDQPLTIIFRNTSRLSAEEMMAKFETNMTHDP